MTDTALEVVGTIVTNSGAAMRAPVLSLITLANLLFPGAEALAHGSHSPQTVTPASEQRSAPRDAPSRTEKVSVEPLGSLDLSREFAALQGRVLRTRRITIAPGGSVAWHQHQQRPGVAYLINGSLIEIRDDGSGPRALRRKAGDAVFESSGVLHGWRNDSDQPATAVVIDLVPQTQP
ncbi:cupin domain-containing protein [Synechococcus sp. MIT S9509]|uniref:cupin domain-containing protein n=1 Tax=Synechococcus sp. MIT S9509 TaxID=1801630 RepID=UPI00083154C8|nr:cupin domain-containing protein [Synechococcus sp. MIT S9509]